MVERLFKVQITREEDTANLELERRPQQFTLSRGEESQRQGARGKVLPLQALSRGQEEKPKPVHVVQKLGRNESCPCGSGKKYKKCCGK